MEFTRFALLGLATGGLYALLSQGLVLIYRGSRLLNFAHGAIAMFGAFAYYELTVLHHWPSAAGLIGALVMCAALGAAVQLVVLRSMRTASPLSKVIATLGILVVLQSAAFLRYGHDPLRVPSLLPTRTVHVISQRLPIGLDRIYIFVICLALSAVLFAVYRFSSFGRITTAAAENQTATSSLGHSPDLIAAANWALGSMLAGLAGILIAPIIYLEPTRLVLLAIPAMSAALIGQFLSFPITFVSALLIGVAQSETQRYVSSPGWSTAAPFLVVIIVLIVRGRGLPLRSLVLERLPKVGQGMVRWPVVVVGTGVLGWWSLTANDDWSTAIATTAALACICLSVVLLTGYTGQLSLAQFALAGVGALVAARLAPHMTFMLAAVIAVLITAVAGGLAGVPALRTRGITLAVATLGLGGAIVAVVLSNSTYTGGVGGLLVPVPTVFGWSIDPIFHASHYAFVTVVVMIGLSLMVANVRRGVTGRRLLAVRSNERAAAALGVNVAWAKTYAFALSSGIAACGGILLAFKQPAIQFGAFDVFSCILIVAVTVAGGVGNVPGAYIGATMISGGVVSKLFQHWSKINDYLPLAGGIILVITLMTGPDGIFEVYRRQLTSLIGPLASRWPARRSSSASLAPIATVERVTERGLSVEHVSVSFGGVHAVRDVCLTVRPGEVHGLIGPNGAGKTTLIDAITGFVRCRGSVAIGDADISGWSARRRAAAGLARSFQSLELFSDLTIGENLAVASDHGAWRHYLADLVRPGRISLGPAASEALRHFELAELIDKRPNEVSFGLRKTVAIARSIASAPSVLLLDEPAAGLDDHEAAELASLIRTLADDWGIAILLVEHKVDMIMSISDRVTVLQSGAILASGEPAEVMDNPAVVEAYLGASVPTAAALG